MRDTRPEIDAMYRVMLLSAPPAERVRMACEMFETARVIMRASLGALADDPIEGRLAILRRTYGNEIDERSYLGVERRLRDKYGGRDAR